MFLPVSQAIAEVTQLAQHKAPYQIIPNFIADNLELSSGDVSPFLTQLPQDGYLLFVGMLGHGKGVEVLLRAYAEMGTQVPLVLIGQPQPDFSATIPPNVYALQSWPHAAVMSAWQRCSIALVPSIALDAFPTVALEAMAMGRPVIASRIGGLSDIVVDGETGLLVPPGNDRALREAIQSLLDDPLQRERMGALARQRVAQFRTKKVVPLIEQVYDGLLQTRSLEEQALA
jgi:glycosyltransferase involved in cell wall biosynthesis